MKFQSRRQAAIPRMPSLHCDAGGRYQASLPTCFARPHGINMPPPFLRHAAMTYENMFMKIQRADYIAG